MSDKENNKVQGNPEEPKIAEVTENQHTGQEQMPDMVYMLRQMEAIQKQTGYLNEVLNQLARMTDGDSGECGAPGNILGEAKAKALGDVVRCRETTNQQMLRLYEKMYDDQHAGTSFGQKKLELIERVLSTGMGLPAEYRMELISEISHMHCNDD